MHVSKVDTLNNHTPFLANKNYLQFASFHGPVDCSAMLSVLQTHRTVTFPTACWSSLRRSGIQFRGIGSSVSLPSVFCQLRWPVIVTNNPYKPFPRSSNMHLMLRLLYRLLHQRDSRLQISKIVQMLIPVISELFWNGPLAGTTFDFRPCSSCTIYRLHWHHL